MDECFLNISGCAETCNNTDGSFECGCVTSGYEIGPDGLNCTGIKL